MLEIIKYKRMFPIQLFHQFRVDEDVIAALQKKGDCQAALLEALKARVEKYVKPEQKPCVCLLVQLQTPVKPEPDHIAAALLEIEPVCHRPGFL